MFDKRNNQDGFTMVEMMIVFALIAILATVMMGSSFLTSRMRGRDTVRKSDLAQVAKALEMYVNDYGVYPGSDADGRILGCGDETTPVACDWGGVFTDVNGTMYMARLPEDKKDPVLNYRYKASSNQSSWQLFARLENDKDPVLDSDGDGSADVEYTQYSGEYCGSTATQVCNYGISSGNTTPDASL